MVFIPKPRRPAGQKRRVKKPELVSKVGARLFPRGTARKLVEKVRSSRQLHHEVDFNVSQRANVIHSPTSVTWRVAGAENKKKRKR